MDSSSRRQRSRSRQPRNSSRGPQLPTIPRSGHISGVPAPPYAAPSRSIYGNDTHYERSGQLWAPASRLTTPPAPPGRTASGGRGAGDNPAPSASPAVGKSKRVRTGCLTCRERHLKCDEGLPECNNCRKSNRECRRGIRLNFIDVQVKDPPCVPPTADWSFQILDESRSIASEYKGGLGRYPRVAPSPSTPDPDFPPTPQAEPTEPQTVSGFSPGVSGGGGRGTSSSRDPYHPNDVGQPPPYGLTGHEERGRSHAGADHSFRATLPLPRPHLGFAAVSGEDAFMLAPLRDQTAGEAPAAPTLDYRPRDGWNATSPSILQLTGPQPHDFRPASHAGLSHQFAPPTGLMTPSSDNTTGERDYLNTDEEIQLMQVFIDEVSIWMGALDKGKHFATTVPYLALKLPMLLNGLMACGARHLAQTATLDGEKAADYYRTAIIQLQRSQRERDADVSECALTAIVLDAYHIMTDKPTQRMHHIDSTRQLVRECGWDASSTGLGAACFWVNVGMEVLSCMSLNRPTTRDPDDWGMDLDFATLGAASRSGSRSVAGSVAGSDDVWSARAGGPRAMSVNDASDPDDEGLWVQRIFYILAKVSNFRANTPRVQESSPHDEQVRLQNRYAEWRRLQNMCTSWNHHSPRSMRPYGYSPGPSPQSLFPNVWLIQPPSKLARLFYHTAMHLLIQQDPSPNTARPPTSQVQLHHAHHVCGIVAHTHTTRGGRDDRGVVSVAIRCLAVVGAALTDAREREEVLRVLGKVGKETGWWLGGVEGDLREAWGWDGGRGDGPDGEGGLPPLGETCLS